MRWERARAEDVVGYEALWYCWAHGKRLGFVGKAGGDLAAVAYGGGVFTHPYWRPSSVAMSKSELLAHAERLVFATLKEAQLHVQGLIEERVLPELLLEEVGELE